MGCNGGPGTLNQHKHLDDLDRKIEKRRKEAQAFYGTKKIRSILIKGRKLEQVINDYWEAGLYSRSYVDRSQIFKKLVKIPRPEDIQALHLKMYKKGPRDILNCGSCGYNSCEQMVTAILNGLNRPENCRHFIEIQKNLL
ncbi:MAG: chemotaxis protein, partial [Spirochaetaceae bacterium]|nr:chemotaxis protein [Spirochaetaceae bacterium]